MSAVEVALGDRSYPIMIETGLLDRPAEALAPYVRDGRLVVISDENVWAMQGDRFSGLEFVPILLPPPRPAKGPPPWSAVSPLKLSVTVATSAPNASGVITTVHRPGSTATGLRLRWARSIARAATAAGSACDQSSPIQAAQPDPVPSFVRAVTEKRAVDRRRLDR